MCSTDDRQVGIPTLERGNENAIPGEVRLALAQ
jgi:hypothetical protein